MSTFTIERRVSGIWQLNSVVVSSGGTVLVVDPGYFPRELDELSALARARGHVAAVAFTHGHWDHVMGWRAFPDAPVVASTSLVAHVRNADAVAAKYLADAADFDGRWYVDRGAAPAWPAAISAWDDGDTRAFGALHVTGHHLRGHSDDGLALLLEEPAVLLAGDHLSPCEIPFVDDLAAYRTTLDRLVALLPRVTEVIPGHGRPLRPDEARAIADDDRRYLDALAGCVARGHVDAARAMPLPRAADVPGMRDQHLENLKKSGLLP